MTAAAFPLTLGGMIGGIVISLLVTGVWRRLAASVLYAIAGGFVIVSIMQPWLGVLQGSYLANVGAMALSLFGTASFIVGTTALIGTFSYLSAMLLGTTGVDQAWVPAVLFGYGLGALIGNAVGGRAADRAPRAVLGVGFAGLLICSLLLALTAAHVGPTVVLVFLLGLLGFSANPALNSRFVAFAPTAPTLAVAGNVSAFNVGITLGPWLAGAALGAGYDYPAVPAIGALIAALALALWAWDVSLERRSRTARVPVA